MATQLTHIYEGTICMGRTASLTPSTPRVQALLANALGQDVVVGIRHGAISIVPAGTPGSIATQVYTVEPAGEITYIQAYIGDKLCTLSTSEHGFHINAGETIHLQLNEDRLYLFEAHEGGAIVA